LILFDNFKHKRKCAKTCAKNRKNDATQSAIGTGNSRLAAESKVATKPLTDLTSVVIALLHHRRKYCFELCLPGSVTPVNLT
jgi:hypothetical protein